MCDKFTLEIKYYNCRIYTTQLIFFPYIDTFPLLSEGDTKKVT